MGSWVSPASTGVGHQTAGFDCFHRAPLVHIRDVSRDSYGAEYGSRLIPDQHSSSRRDEFDSLQGGGTGYEEWTFGREVGDGPGAHAHSQSPPRLALSDLKPSDPRTVLTLGHHQMATRVENRNRQGFAFELHSPLENPIGNDVCLSKSDGRHLLPTDAWESTHGSDNRNDTRWMIPMPSPTST